MVCKIMLDKDQTNVPSMQEPGQILLNANICSAWHLAMHTWFLM